MEVHTASSPCRAINEGYRTAPGRAMNRVTERGTGAPVVFRGVEAGAVCAAASAPPAPGAAANARIRRVDAKA